MAAMGLARRMHVDILLTIKGDANIQLGIPASRKPAYAHGPCR